MNHAELYKNRDKRKQTSENGGNMIFRLFLYGGMLILMLYIYYSAGFPVQASDRARLELHATGAVLMDGESGRVLYEKDGEKPLANASTTKILTCITVLENCADLDEEVSVSAYAASMPKVKLYLKKGDTCTVKELLYSLMLESHNDSAVALAEHLGKEWVEELRGREPADFSAEESQMAVKAFARCMNEKAGKIGCSDTWFITPNGLDAVETITEEEGTVLTLEHHTTARDLALILSYCILKSPERENFLQITRQSAYSFTENQRTYSCSNHNSFLNMMEGALSGKTGFTGKAGYCYAGALEREGKYYVVALLGCGWPDHKTWKWMDTRKLMEYGLSSYHRADFYSDEVLYPEEDLQSVPVKNGQGEGLDGECSVELRIAGRDSLRGSSGILLREGERIQVCVSVKRSLEAPVKKGEKAGEIRYVVDEEVYFTEDIVTTQDRDKVDLKWILIQIFEIFLKGKL